MKKDGKKAQLLHNNNSSTNGTNPQLPSIVHTRGSIMKKEDFDKMNESEI